MAWDQIWLGIHPDKQDGQAFDFQGRPIHFHYFNRTVSSSNGLGVTSDLREFSSWKLVNKSEEHNFICRKRLGEDNSCNVNAI